MHSWNKQKRNTEKTKEAINRIEEELQDIYPYTSQEEKIILKQCNKLLHKDENGNYDRLLKYTDYRFVFDIIEPFLNDLYARHGLSTNDVYKHNLYFILCVLTRMYGEKNINMMLNIDEAQDITVNEYKLIKKANLRGGNDNISIAYLKKESGES